MPVLLLPMLTYVAGTKSMLRVAGVSKYTLSAWCVGRIAGFTGIFLLLPEERVICAT